MTNNTHPLPILAAVDSSTAWTYDKKWIDILAERDSSVEMKTLFDRLAKAAIRETLRDQTCDKIPTLDGLMINLVPNRWGDNILFEVTYCHRGWRASYGGHFDPETNRFVWQCYMN